MGKRFWIFGLVSACVIAADQFTKWLVTRSIPLNEGLTAVPGLVSVVHARNPGAAFGIMAQHSTYYRGAFLVLVSLVALAIVLYLVCLSKNLDGYLLIAYTFFFGGAAGNLIDRLRYGEVIDFIDVYVGRYHWPAFNVADSVLCIGVALLAIHSLKGGLTGRDIHRKQPRGE